MLNLGEIPSAKDSIKLSIVTVVYNGVDTIADAIESVLGQSYGGLEYIVIDGQSRDGSVSVIQKYANRINTFVSEPDSGIYDAMNKGIRLASGDVIGFLNADDFYANSEVLKSVASTFLSSSCDVVYGDLVYVDSKDTRKIKRYWKSGAYKFAKFRFGWHPPHPAFFVKTELLKRSGGFDTGMNIAADYELMFRLLYVEKLHAAYLPLPLVKMRLGGESNRSIRNVAKANMQCMRAWKKNAKPMPILLVPLKLSRKCLQYFWKPSVLLNNLESKPCCYEKGAKVSG